MNRRAFIKRNGLWLTGAVAFPAIIRSQVLPSARRIASPAPAAAASSCDTIKDSYASTHASNTHVGGDRKYLASKQAFTDSYTACKLDIYSYKQAATTFTIRSGIYSHNGGSNQPDALQGGWSDALLLSTFPITTPALVTFSNMTGTVTATTMWIVLEVSGVDFSDFAYVDIQNATGSNRVMYSANGSTWTNVGDSLEFKFNLYA